MRIDIYMDFVVVEGQMLWRPSYIARSVWMIFWERMQRHPKV